MNRRGSALLLILFVLAAGMSAWSVFHMRLTMDVQARPADEVRLQALVLGRTALLAGTSGTHEVDTARGRARVRVLGPADARVVEVDLAGARAEVGGRPYVERFDPGAGG